MSERLTQVTVSEKQEIHKLLPGEVAYVNRHDTWFIGCPSENCGAGSLASHTVVYLEKLLTVSPSILCGCGAHYFIVNNEIRWCS